MDSRYTVMKCCCFSCDLTKGLSSSSVIMFVVKCSGEMCIKVLVSICQNVLSSIFDIYVDL